MAEVSKKQAALRRHVWRYGFIAAMSAAIWAFAEARSLTTSSRTVTLVLSAPAGSPLTVWNEADRARRVAATLRLEGSRAALDRAGQRLAEPLELLVGEGLPTTTGRATVSLREALRGHRAFDRLAVTLLDTSPPSIEVMVDELVERNIPVRVPVSGLALDRPVEVTPATVTVIGPASILNAASFDALEAVIEPGRLGQLRAGTTTQLQGLSITIPAPWRTDLVRISPMTVSAAIAPRDTIESHTLSSVPVMVRLSPTQLRQWRVRIAPEEAYLRDVIVRGPGEAIEAIRSGRQRVVATLLLEGEELTPGSAEYPAVLSAPLEGLRFEVGDTRVPVEIVAIDPGSEGGE